MNLVKQTDESKHAHIQDFQSHPMTQLANSDPDYTTSDSTRKCGSLTPDQIYIVVFTSRVD
jgi:hypothetical protein